ncbi:MAG: fibronectin type III domain-containing protein [Candidatus Absconditabacterales bacterium]|nr:fibronectin type III domain-containing protein [Candidatus Absconditabacterales bacterium]
MNKFYKKLVFGIFIFFSALVPLVSLAEDPDSFLVKVDPDTFGVGQAVDITVTALKNGVVLQDYIGDVFFEIKGLMPDDYVVPSMGFYSFLIQDQGTKTFSKGLEIKKPGTYQVKVYDITDVNEEFAGFASVIVGNTSSNQNLKQINITSPINSSTEKKSTINVIGSSFDLRNSPIDVYLNDMLVASSNTDSMGNFNVYISNLNSGQNTIQAKILDIDNILLGESSVVVVNYQPPFDGVFNSIEILPSGTLKEGDKVTFTVSTVDDVSSAQMLFSDGSSYPLDLLSPGIFKKDMIMTDVVGDIDVSVSLMYQGLAKNYDDVASISIKENKGVGNVKFVTTGVDGSSVIVSWDSIGNSPKYRVSYGTDKNSLQKTVDINSTEVLIENLQINTTYYFQISPLDDESHSSGEPSSIVEYNPQETKHSCVVQGITVKSEKIGDKYFLLRDEVENATKYEIYRSDWEDMSDKKLVGETTETKFEYFFDKYAEKDQYAYYQVQAICSDGTNVTVDKAQKVQVGPFENTILIIIITLFLYAVYKLYRTQKY